MRTVLVVTAALLSLTAAVPARAAEDEVARDAAACKQLSGPDRGHCLECVSRPRPHGWHKSAPPATRCQPAPAPTK